MIYPVNSDEISKYILYTEFTIGETLAKINGLGIDAQGINLFVISSEGKIKGSVTEGDIRRGLLNKVSLDSKISLVMNESFHYLKGKIDPSKVNSFRKMGVQLLPYVNESNQILRIYDLRKLKNILPLEAVLMAGGRGKRLSPLTDSTPKPMMPISEKPILEHNIDLLISYGIKTIHISVNYLSEKIIDYFGNGSSKGITIKYIFEDEPLGTAGALSNLTGVESNNILLMNGDLLTNINLSKLYKDHKLSDSNLTIASTPYNVNIPYGVLELSENNRVTGIKEKPKYTYYSNAGIYIIKTELIRRIPTNSFYNITDLIELLISEKSIVSNSEINGYWIDIGNINDYEYAKRLSEQLSL